MGLYFLRWRFFVPTVIGRLGRTMWYIYILAEKLGTWRCLKINGLVWL